MFKLCKKNILFLHAEVNKYYKLEGVRKYFIFYKNVVLYCVFVFLCGSISLIQSMTPVFISFVLFFVA